MKRRLFIAGQCVEKAVCRGRCPHRPFHKCYKFMGNIGKIGRFYPWAGVGTGPYIHENKIFDSLILFFNRNL